jgi:hypothetical protein
VELLVAHMQCNTDAVQHICSAAQMQRSTYTCELSHWGVRERERERERDRERRGERGWIQDREEREERDTIYRERGERDKHIYIYKEGEIKREARR